MLETVLINGAIRATGERVTMTERAARQYEQKFIIERDEKDWPVYEPLPPKPALKDVMVFTPVYRLEPETVQAVLQLEFDGPISWLFQRDNPITSGKEIGKLNILHQYRRARETFLEGSYDAMLVIESDIIPPSDTIRKLEALNSDCAYGVYRFRVSDVINIFERYPGAPRNMGESISIKPHILRQAIKIGKLPCSGAGLGCVLIRRNVLEAIDFRLENNMAHCDSWFNQDVLRAGFTQWADMSVICGHKDEQGVMLWPRLS